MMLLQMLVVVILGIITIFLTRQYKNLLLFKSGRFAASIFFITMGIITFNVFLLINKIYVISNFISVLAIIFAILLLNVLAKEIKKFKYYMSDLLLELYLLLFMVNFVLIYPIILVLSIKYDLSNIFIWLINIILSVSVFIFCAIVFKKRWMYFSMFIYLISVGYRIALAHTFLSYNNIIYFIVSIIVVYLFYLDYTITGIEKKFVYNIRHTILLRIAVLLTTFLIFL